MSEVDHSEDPNVRYDRERCRVCGAAWEPFRDEHGRIHAGHPYGQTCSRYRPAEVGVPADGIPSVPTPFLAEGLFEAAAVIHGNGEPHS